MDLALRPNVVHHLLVEQQLLILDPRFRFRKQLEGHFGTYPPIRATLHHHKRHIVLFELVSALFQNLKQSEESAKSNFFRLEQWVLLAVVLVVGVFRILLMFQLCDVQLSRQNELYKPQDKVLEAEGAGVLQRRFQRRGHQHCAIEHLSVLQAQLVGHCSAQRHPQAVDWHRWVYFFCQVDKFLGIAHETVKTLHIASKSFRFAIASVIVADGYDISGGEVLGQMCSPVAVRFKPMEHSNNGFWICDFPALPVGSKFVDILSFFGIEYSQVGKILFGKGGKASRHCSAVLFRGVGLVDELQLLGPRELYIL